MIRVLLEGPILTNSGYGEHARLVYKSLIQDENIDIFINPLSWGKTSWLPHKNTDFHTSIESDVQKLQNYVNISKERKQNMSFDIQVFVGIPSEFTKKAPYSVCVTAGIETDRVSAEWLIRTHKGIDKVIVPSMHAKAGFVKTKYEVQNNQTKQRSELICGCPVEVVPYPAKQLTLKELDFETSTDFNFLSVSLLGPRKNIENMVKWFTEEFKNENVGLILKTAVSTSGAIDRENTVEAIKSVIIPQSERKCKVYLLHGDLEESEIHSLYNRQDVHAYVSATHGEGYGLPIFESSYYGLPVVATNWSAHTEFLSGPLKESGKVKNKKLFAKVDFDLKEIPKSIVWKDVLVEGSIWAYPKETSFKTQIRKMYENHGMYKKWAEILKKQNRDIYSEEKVLELMRTFITKDFKLQGLQASELEGLEGYSDEIVL